eukprot:gene16635-biopygen8027
MVTFHRGSRGGAGSTAEAAVLCLLLRLRLRVPARSLRPQMGGVGRPEDQPPRPLCARAFCAPRVADPARDACAASISSAELRSDSAPPRAPRAMCDSKGVRLKPGHSAKADVRGNSIHSLSTGQRWCSMVGCDGDLSDSPDGHVISRGPRRVPVGVQHGSEKVILMDPDPETERQIQNLYSENNRFLNDEF